MKKVLIFNKLKSQINFQDLVGKSQDEPLHPYMGIKWAQILINLGFKVEYLNYYNKSSNKIINFIIKFFQVPKRFSTIVVYSTNGLGNVTLLRLFNWNVNIVYFSLSKINPDGNIIKLLFRKIFAYTDNLCSNHIVVGLNVLNDHKFKNITYFPFFSDVNYFNEKVNNSRAHFEYKGEFILIVGDITRDDSFVYSELSELTIPIIRITRDKSLISKLNNIINIRRGDVILSGISFEQLALFYKYSKLCIVASRYDHWQPGGITSIVEALACKGICLCNSGGEIEKEFNFLCDNSNVNNPLFYFDYPQKNSLKDIVVQLLNKPENELNELKVKSFNFSNQVLNLNTYGIPKLHDLINNHFI
jgi:hypothetical protein